VNSGTLFDDKAISPMLIGRDEPPFDDPDYIFELKLDGERCLAYLSDSGTEFRNKRHKLMNPHVPELLQIHKQVKRECVLDGELFVMVNGAPDFSEIQRRSLMSDPLRISAAARRHPASFTAFDILYRGGRDLIGLPLMERKRILEETVTENERAAVSRYIAEKGTLLFESAKERGLEGIVAKRRDSVYKPGTRTTDWIKMKNLLDEDFIVAGYIEKSGNVVSVILGEEAGGAMLCRGHVTLGISRAELRIIRARKRAACPFAVSEPGAVYIEPSLVCTVKFMERTAGGGLRQPVFKGLRFDK